MEAPKLEPEGAPRLRLVEGGARVAQDAPARLGAWTLLFGALAFSGGHGVFLFTALTRLAKIPGRTELGGPLELAVVGWFVAAVPLAIASGFLRGQLVRLSARAAWSLTSVVLALTLAAFVIYLRAVALA